MTLWIEALNRRLERSWLRDACRSARAAGQADALRAFFEKQQARSPRDVRWAVAVREIRLQLGDLAGAIEMARAADRRPSRARVAVARGGGPAGAGRPPREAADLLEGWAKPRPADEDAARLAQRAARRRGRRRQGAGGGARRPRGLREAGPARRDAAERAPGPARPRRSAPPRQRLPAAGLEARRSRRRSRAARGERPRAVGRGGAGPRHRQLRSPPSAPRRRRGFPDDGRARSSPSAAGPSSGRKCRPSCSARSSRRRPPAARAATRPSPAWWPFVQEAGLEAPLRAAIARRKLGATPGPWSARAARRLRGGRGRRGRGEQRRREGAGLRPDPAQPRRALGSRSRPPRRRARPRVVPRSALASARRAGARRHAARARSAAPRLGRLARRQGRSRDLGSRCGRFPRRGWPRSRPSSRSGGGGTACGPLPLAAGTWLRSWPCCPRTRVSPGSDSGSSRPRSTPIPCARARGEALERASVAVGRLVAGQPGAAADPVIARLRGPRTVGDVLGADTRWTWPEFTPRRDAAGVSLETGDDAVIGQRADALRTPGALWGERPGDRLVRPRDPCSPPRRRRGSRPRPLRDARAGAGGHPSAPGRAPGRGHGPRFPGPRSRRRSRRSGRPREAPRPARAHAAQGAGRRALPGRGAPAAAAARRGRLPRAAANRGRRGPACLPRR